MDDIASHHILIRCKNSQVKFWPPDSQNGIILAAALFEIKRRTHGLVKRQGRLDCKTSWLARFKNLQWFSSHQPNEWLPESYVDKPDSETPENFKKCVSSSECCVLSVGFHHDAEAEKKWRQSTRFRPKYNDRTTISSHHLSDTIWLLFPKLNLTTVSSSWHAILDVFNKLLFRVDSAEQETTDQLETFKFKSWLTQESVENRSTLLQDLQDKVRYVYPRRTLCCVEFLWCMQD